MTIHMLLHVLRIPDPIAYMPVIESRKGKGLSDGNVALFGQRSVDTKEIEDKDLTDGTCHGCGKKGHLRRRRPTKRDERVKNKKLAAQRKASSSKTRATTAKKPPLGKCSTQLSRAPQYPPRKDSLQAVSTLIRERPTVEGRFARLERIRVVC